MTRKHLTRITALLLALLLCICMSGCGQNGSTIEEPDEITVEYLTGEYADQLTRDGATVTLGTVALTGTNGTYNITVESMVIVESDITDEGYYIADKNVSETVPLDPTARITYLGEDGAQIISIEEFAEIVTGENYDPLEVGNEQLYDVYTIGGNAVLLLAKELPTVE